MTLKPCPRCGTMIPHGKDYCTDCKPIAMQQLQEYRRQNAAKRQQRYNRTRNTKYLQFYRSKEWRMTSRSKLQSCQYKCEAKLQGCTHLAVEVHHIKPIQTVEGWELRLDWDNLEALCTHCHNMRHPEKFHRAVDDGVLDLRSISKPPGGG